MARPRAASASPKSQDPSAWLAYLLSQVGAHAAGRFADRLEPLGLKPPHTGILRKLDQADGLSQQALGETLNVFPSRLVALLDELEGRRAGRATGQAGRPALIRAMPDRRGCEA